MNKPAKTVRAKQDQADAELDPRQDVVAWSRHNWGEQGLDHGDSLALMASIGRLNQLITAEIEAVLKPFSLGSSRYLLLMTLLLTSDGRQRMSRLSWHMMVHPTTVTVVVDHLERDGLVVRTPDPTDRRATVIEMTPAGRALTEKASRRLAELNFGLPDLDDRKIPALLDQLTTLRAAMGDVRPTS